ncbi:MAG: response regulator [Actinomycetota bacterium]
MELTGLTVLVVDDEDAVRRMISRSLDRNGLITAQASSVSDAIEKIDAAHFDLVITDMNMPGGSGSELIAYLTLQHPTTATVMVSGLGDPVLGDLTTSLGGDVFIAKPFDETQLIEAVATAITRHRGR